jgi:hypothetical protein
MLKELDGFVNDNMSKLKYAINDMPNNFPFNLADDLSDQYRHCDLRKLYDVINNKLHPKYRAALILRYRYKLPYKRIEEDLGYSSGYGRIVMRRILFKLRNYYNIYVYDKKYINSYIKDYDHEIDNLNTDIDKLKKYKDYLMDEVLKDNPNMDRSSLISKMDNALKLMNTDIIVLNLSPRTYTILDKRYNNLYQLSRATIEELYEMNRFNIATIKEIVDKLYYNGIYIEHETIKNINTGQVKYISKNDKDKINYKYWKLL